MNRTAPAWSLTILRVVVGLIFVMHGYPKLFAGGMPGTIEMFGQLGIPLPVVAAWLVAILETVGGLALILGIFVTPVAILLGIHMLTGIFLVHLPNGFYVIGPGQGGFEFNLLLIAALITLITLGPGPATVGVPGGRQSAEEAPV